MGCDIHVVAEARTDGVWTAVTEPIFPGDQFDVMHGRPLVVEPFGWRSYSMFTLFAGVRDRGEGIRPISEPRGLPADATEESRNALGHEFDYDMHSRSWLAVADLLGVDQDVSGFLGDIYDEHLAVLQALGKPDDVRIVFAFDN